MEDHDINDDIDYEIEEDDWAMDPDIDNRLQTCIEFQIRDLGEPCPDSEWKDTILYLKQNINWADQGLLDKIVDRRPLKHDPVEWTRQWEEVIDEVEQKTYKKLKGEPRGMGFCFSYWPALHSALLKYGIEWRNPRQMNPRVIFD